MKKNDLVSNPPTDAFFRPRQQSRVKLRQFYSLPRIFNGQKQLWPTSPDWWKVSASLEEQTTRVSAAGGGGGGSRALYRDQRAEQTSHTKSPSTNHMTVNAPEAQSNASKSSAAAALLPAVRVSGNKACVRDVHGQRAVMSCHAVTP